MATHLEVEEALVQEARQIGGHKTAKAAVQEALREYVDRRKQLQALELFGRIDFDPEWDYKKQRRLG